jgi:hypothetical protein
MHAPHLVQVTDPSPYELALWPGFCNTKQRPLIATAKGVTDAFSHWTAALEVSMLSKGAAYSHLNAGEGYMGTYSLSHHKFAFGMTGHEVYH